MVKSIDAKMLLVLHHFLRRNALRSCFYRSIGWDPPKGKKITDIQQHRLAHLRTRIGRHSLRALMNTGAEVSAMHMTVYRLLQPNPGKTTDGEWNDSTDRWTGNIVG